MSVLYLGAVTRPPVTQECQAILAQHAQSFRWASWFLPGEMRRDAAIVYAFCRIVDDTVDEAPSPSVGRRGVLAIGNRLRAQTSDDALVEAYRSVAERRGFGMQPAFGLIAGAMSDSGTVRIEDDAELLTYCYRVAGTVGLMMCGVLGVTSAAARAHAVQLGVAMQLTNICRDVREDAALGRVYLPQSRALAAGMTKTSLEPGLLLCATSEDRLRVSDVVLSLIADSERLYTQAARGFRYIPARPRLAVMVAAHLYRAIGRRLRKRRGDALAGRTIVPAWLKAALVLQVLVIWLVGLLLPPRRELLLGSASPARGTEPPAS